MNIETLYHPLKTKEQILLLVSGNRIHSDDVNCLTKNILTSDWSTYVGDSFLGSRKQVTGSTCTTNLPECIVLEVLNCFFMTNFIKIYPQKFKSLSTIHLIHPSLSSLNRKCGLCLTLFVKVSFLDPPKHLNKSLKILLLGYVK